MSTGINTKGLSDAQIDCLAKIVMQGDRTYWLLPFMIGFWLNAVLFGVLVVLFMRWQTSVAKTDRWWVKAIVYYLVVLHCLGTGYIVGYQQNMFASGFGQFGQVVNVSWARPANLLNAFSRVPWSAFFTYRAWFLYRRNWAIPIFITPLFLGCAVCAIGAVVAYDYVPMPPSTRQYVLAMCSLGVATDVSLTTLLAIALLRSKTAFEQTNQLIMRILWTHTAYFLAAPRIYPICLLILLNSRETYSTMARSALHAPSAPSHTIDNQSKTAEIGVLVERETHVVAEEWAPYPAKRSSKLDSPMAGQQFDIGMSDDSIAVASEPEVRMGRPV